MIKVLLADDEPVITRGLKKLIPWESFGMSVIGETTDGGQTEQVLLKLEPDILISDICMPNMTGIDILKQINNKNLKTKVIFMSGFQEFSYAKDAITYGAIDYLLKPIDKAQLENTLRKVVEIITRDQEDDSIRNKLYNYEVESNSKNISGLIDRAVGNNIEPWNNKDTIISFGNSAKLSFFTFVCLEIDEIHDNKDMSDKELKLIKFAVFNQVEQALAENTYGIVFYRGNNICAIINHSDENADSVRTVATKVAEIVKNNLNKRLTIGIGETVLDIKHIHDSYQSSVDDLKTKLSKRNENDIEKVKEFIDKNFDKNITLETVAGIACMNSYYFSSLFKKKTGENFKDYLTKVRMQKAMKLLTTTDFKTYEIAERVGFNDAKHFSEIFKKYYGKKPAEYKKKDML